MIRIFLVIISALLTGMQLAAKDGKLCLYWALVCAYWVVNTIDWRSVK